MCYFLLAVFFLTYVWARLFSNHEKSGFKVNFYDKSLLDILSLQTIFIMQNTASFFSSERSLRLHVKFSAIIKPNFIVVYRHYIDLNCEINRYYFLIFDYIHFPSTLRLSCLYSNQIITCYLE